MHVFFLCIFVYSYLLHFYFFSQQDPIDNSTWYLGVILIKYSMMMMMLIINIIIINLRLAVQIPDSPPPGQMPGGCRECEGFELVGAYDFQQPIRVTSGIANVKDPAENGEVEGKTSNQVTVSVGCVDGDQL